MSTSSANPHIYQGRSVEELIPKIQADLGDDAIVVRRRKGLTGGIGGFFQRPFVEIEARPGTPRIDMYDEDDAALPAPMPQEPAPMPTAMPAAMPAPAPTVTAPAPEWPVAAAQTTDWGAQTPQAVANWAPQAPQTAAEQVAQPPQAPLDPRGFNSAYVTAALAALAAVSSHETKPRPAIAREDATPRPDTPPYEDADQFSAALAAAEAAVAEQATVAATADHQPPAYRSQGIAAAQPVDGQWRESPTAQPTDTRRPEIATGHPADAQRPEIAAEQPTDFQSREPTTIGAGHARASVQRSLLDVGVDQEFIDELIGAAVAHALALNPRLSLARAVHRTLRQRIPVCPPLPGAGATIALVGPGGGGKTACCAGLLGAYRRGGTLPAACATIVGGAAGELAMLLSPHVLEPTAVTAPHASRVLRRAREEGMLLLDMPPLSPADGPAIDTLAALLDELAPDRVVVALPATLGARPAAQLLEALRPLNPSALAITHADATDQLGVAVQAACTFGLAPEYLLDRAGSHGGLTPIDPTYLADRLLS
jgi:flagellar biosynthesis GTPase FlhF